MIVVGDADLSLLMDLLRHEFPRSLPVYHLVRNEAIRKQYAWPGLEFVVDRFPDTSVCIARLSPSRQDAVPLVNGYTAYIFSKNAEAFRAVLKEEGVVAWTKSILFPTLPKPESSILQAHFESAGLGTRSESCPHTFLPAVLLSFDLTALVPHKYTLPVRLRLGELRPEHSDQLAAETQYGNLPVNQIYFRYLLEHKFPNVCVYNEGDRPIAYLMQKPEGNIGAGFVSPNYRSIGLYKIVVFELLKKLRDCGETFTYADAAPDNEHSIRGLRSMGGVLYEKYEADWVDFIPSEK